MNLPDEKQIIGWRISGENDFVKEKCDKCDSERLITFYSPSGQRYREWCTCASQRYYKLYPVEVDLVKFKVNKDTGEIRRYYRITDDDEYENYQGFELIHEFDPDKHDIYDLYENRFLIDHKYEFFFANKEDAQKICDYLNEKAIQKEIEREERQGIVC